ncbi:MAG: class I SAM-dependent methyltransferase, partial [Bacteriovoracaceae bacterium]
MNFLRNSPHASEIGKSIEKTQNEFPFQNYLDKKFDAYHLISSTIKDFLPQGGTILDFGAGSCDKTAVLQNMGYQCSAADDLQDHWHEEKDSKNKILNFADSIGINYILLRDQKLELEENQYDMVMSHDVIEHLHDSPKDLLNILVKSIKPGGYLFLSVPNAVNLRKRISVLKGETNYPPYDQFYWYPGPWRGHVREYTKNDLSLLSQYLKLDLKLLKGADHMIWKLPTFARFPYYLFTNFFDGMKDTLYLIAQKPNNWNPVIDSEEQKAILQKSTTFEYKGKW